MGLTETITALVEEGMRQSAEHAEEEKEKAMTETMTAIKRTVNVKEIRKVMVRGKLFSVVEGSATHTDDGVEVEYTTTRGTKTVFIKAGTFGKNLRHW